jgi:hypothetical protein
LPLLVCGLRARRVSLSLSSCLRYSSIFLASCPEMFSLSALSLREERECVC